MGTSGSRRRWLLVGVTLSLAAAVVTGSVIAGQFRSVDPEALRADLATGEVTRVADIAAADGHPGRGVFVQVTERGQVCMFEALSASAPQRGGGCNSADDPLGGSEISVSLSYEGGPAVSSTRDARLIGLAARDVAAVDVVMSDGTRRRVRLKAARIDGSDLTAFGYRFRRSDLREGIGPVAVVALDATGVELARQVTGIGG